MTVYRQNAMRCLKLLHETDNPEQGLKGAKVAKSTGVERATTLMAKNHYGWFEALGKGYYRLTDEGLAAAQERKETLKNLDYMPAS